MQRILLTALIIISLTGCGTKDKFTGKWLNLEDSLSLNNSKPVYFEKIWLLLKYDDNVCAVKYSQIQNQIWNKPKYFYGDISKDTVSLKQITENGNNTPSISIYANQIQIKIVENRLLDSENDFYDMDSKSIFITKVKNDELRVKCDHLGFCNELLNCEKYLNYFSNLE